MTWISYTIYLVMGYIFYYIAVIVFDLLKKPAKQAGEVETLKISDTIETIQVGDYDDDDIVITVNNSDVEDSKIENQVNNNNSEKEVKSSSEEQEKEQKLEEPEIENADSIVETAISKNGGVPLKSLAEMYRLKAIRESNKLPFAS